MGQSLPDHGPDSLATAPPFKGFDFNELYGGPLFGGL
jgi:hypothetical protein